MSGVREEPDHKGLSYTPFTCISTRGYFHGSDPMTSWLHDNNFTNYVKAYSLTFLCHAYIHVHVCFMSTIQELKYRSKTGVYTAKEISLSLAL